MWGEFCGDLTKLDHHGSYLQATVAICVNDSKSLADALLSAGAAASKVSEDKRLAIEMGMSCSDWHSVKLDSNGLKCQ